MRAALIALVVLLPGCAWLRSPPVECRVPAPPPALLVVPPPLPALPTDLPAAVKHPGG